MASIRSEIIQSMDDMEFKAEAKRRGYNLIKIQPYVKLLPCVCGNKRPSCRYVSYGKQRYFCPNCGLHAVSENSERKTKLNWNKMIEEKMKE